MKDTYTGCLHFVCAKQLLHLRPNNNSRNKTFKQRGEREKKKKKVNLHFDPLTEKLKVWGTGGEGKSSSLPLYLPNQQLLPACWMLAPQGKAALHILSFPSCSPVFHRSKQAEDLRDTQKWKNSSQQQSVKLSYRVWLLTHCSVTPITTCTGKCHTRQVSRTTAGMGLGTNVQ